MSNPVSNHRKKWTIEEETRFAKFMIEQFRLGKKIGKAIEAANVEFKRKNCADRWKYYGLLDLYAKEIKEAREEARERKV